MSLQLGLRTLAILALVAAATVLLASPALVGAAGPHPALGLLPLVGHH